MPQLHLQSGSREGEVIELTGEIITIGSAPGNMIELDGADVEPFHATLVADEGDYVLCDQQSGAGSFVNGAKIDEQKLVAGDQIFLASVSMLYASNIPQPDTPAMQLFVPPSPAPAAFTPATRIPMRGHRGTVPTAPPPAKAKGASPWLRLVVLALVIFVAVELVLLQRKPWQATTTGAVPAATPSPVPVLPVTGEQTKAAPPLATPAPAPAPRVTDAPAPAQPSTPATPAPRTGEDRRWATIIRDSGILPASSEPAALQFADALRADFQLGDEDPLTVLNATLALPKPVSPDEITARVGRADSIRRGVASPGGTDLHNHHLYGKLALLVDAQTGFIVGFSVPSAWWKGGLRRKALAALGGSEFSPSPPVEGGAPLPPPSLPAPTAPAAAGDTTIAPAIPGPQPQLPAGNATLCYRWRSPDAGSPDRWRSLDAGSPLAAAGITVKEVIVNGTRVPEIKGTLGGKGVIPLVGNKRSIDLPGSKDIRIEIDLFVRQTNYAGLAFMAPCVVEILADGTLVADRENIRTTDKSGKAWVSRRCILNGQTVIAFLP